MNLLDDESLERSAVVANSTMNRQRGLAGVNSYEKELGFNPVELLTNSIRNRGAAAWLDLCCGQGKALIEAAKFFAQSNSSDKVTLVGIDLVDAFDPVPAELTNTRLIAASLHRWRPNRSFDLITCVHGLHYIGDKLGLIERAANWLTPEGTFVAHLDLANVRGADGSPFNRRLLGRFLKLGLHYNRRRRILTCAGRNTFNFGLRFVGADENAGPNFTRQDAVDSYYSED
jgi:SAM-dependent methyltransferase